MAEETKEKTAAAAAPAAEAAKLPVQPLTAEQILADEPIAVDTSKIKRAKNGRLVLSGVVHVESTVNNTRGVITDPQGNVAMTVDKAVLGSHRDGVAWAEDGSWRFMKRYQYTWILSSLNFAVTVLLGCFAGQILRRKKPSPARRAGILAGVGVLLIAAGLSLSPVFPIIKKIWSSTMTLYSGGICFLLTALFYYIIDVMKWRRGLSWLEIYGMNAITAYCIGEFIIFDSVSGSFLIGFADAAWYPVLVALANALILLLILRLMYRHKVFLKV